MVEKLVLTRCHSFYVLTIVFKSSNMKGLQSFLEKKRDVDEDGGDAEEEDSPYLIQSQLQRSYQGELHFMTSLHVKLRIQLLRWFINHLNKYFCF